MSHKNQYKLIIFLILFFKISFAQNQNTKIQTQKNLAPKAPEIILRWIDVRGNLLSTIKPTGTTWIWSYRSDTAEIKTPAVRVWLKSNLDPNWKAKFLSAEGATLIKAPENAGDEMILDLRSTKAPLRFKFTQNDGKEVELTLVAQAIVNRTYTFSTPECEKADLFLKIKQNEAKHLFLGVYCVDEKNYVNIYAIRSDDAKWAEGTESFSLDPNQKQTELKQQLYRGKEAIIYTKAILPGGTTDEYGGKTEYFVLYLPKEKPKKLYASAGLGVTLYSYKETLPQINLSQTSLTAKINVGYRLIPKLLDVAFNAFGNVYTLSHSPQTFPDGTTPLPNAYFYGLNGRLGYRLPVGLGATEFMFLSGIYWWKMLVNAQSEDTSYGIKSLNGPQLFLMAVNSPQGKKGWYAYLKLALISDKLSVQNINNREVAIGGGYELSKKDQKPWSVTLDMAHTRFFNEINGMTLLSTTVGIARGL
jgi:hypothetical protein